MCFRFLLEKSHKKFFLVVHISIWVIFRPYFPFMKKTLTFFVCPPLQERRKKIINFYNIHIIVLTRDGRCSPKKEDYNELRIFFYLMISLICFQRAIRNSFKKLDTFFARSPLNYSPMFCPRMAIE